MASQINPNNIDGAYPIAGQDNNSQGFRDNFTNIKVNFQYAEDEINDLENKALLKSPLTGTTLDNNMNDNLIYAAKIQDFSATKVAVTDTSGTVSINYAAGHYQTIRTTDSITLNFLTQYWPANGSYGWIRLQIYVTSTAHTVTLPAAVTLGIDNLQGYNPNTRVITFNQTGRFEFEFTTYDGGTTITIHDLSRNMDPIYLPNSEDLANGATVSPNVTASYFTTVTGETAVLGAGYEGQIKTFMMKGLGGNMVITVANPGWDGLGRMTFSDVGDGCMLQYISGKWFCVGNNGVVFS